MPRETLAEFFARKVGLTVKQVATELKTELPGLGDTITESELDLSDNTTANASSTKHGFLKKLSNVAAEVLDGQGAFRTIAAILGYTPADAATAVLTNDSRLTDARTPTGSAGGVLSGTYPNPGFAADMATQAELDAGLATKQNVITPAAHIADPTGGGTEDAEARATIAAILDALEAKGILSAS